jgi:hypothetical protein
VGPHRRRQTPWPLASLAADSLAAWLPLHHSAVQSSLGGEPSPGFLLTSHCLLLTETNLGWTEALIPSASSVSSADYSSWPDIKNSNCPFVLPTFIASKPPYMPVTILSSTRIGRGEHNRVCKCFLDHMIFLLKTIIVGQNICSFSFLISGYFSGSRAGLVVITCNCWCLKSQVKM